MFKGKLLKKATATLAALSLTITACLYQPVFAENSNGNDGINISITTIKQNITYEEYLNKHGDIAANGQTISINPAEFTMQQSCSVKDKYEGFDGKALCTSSDGYAEWTVNVAASGYYCIKLDYYPMPGNGGNIQRSVFIDGELPFDEATNIVFKRVFKDQTAIEHVKAGNDIRPKQIECPAWQVAYIKDANGYYGEKLYFYLTQGKHTIRFNSLDEPMAIGSIALESKPESVKDYNSILKEYENKKISPVKGELTDGLKIIQAENSYQKSDPTLYPVVDNSSPADQPYDLKYEKLNSIGGTKWGNSGEWISWQVDVPKSGLYEIGFRYLQNYVRDINPVRAIYIDGKLPFKEASEISFGYNGKWSVSLAGGKNPYLFYLEKGKRTITMEVNLGKLATSIVKASNCLKTLNNVSWQYLTLMGINPDQNRDYNIKKYMPDTLTTLSQQANVLNEVVNSWVAVTGKEDADTAQLKQLIFLIKKMTKSPNQIPALYSTFRDMLGSVGNTLLNVKKQPLKLDYLFIAEQGSKLPIADYNVFTSFKYGILKFFVSFVNDYNNLSSGSDHKSSITVWIGNGLTGGRDQANVLSSLIKQDFSPEYKIPVKLELIPPSTILTATVSGKSPDVALQVTGGDPANYAMRHAVIDLSKFSDFKTIAKRFVPETMVPYMYSDGYYALPETFSFPMMFYRKDILTKLGLDINNIKTWQDLIAILPVIQKQNMNIALPPTYNSYVMFLYQKNCELYKNGNRETNLGSKAALDAFNYFMRFFNNYSLPYSYNFVTRFRTGEIPIGIDDYTTYNLLQVSAPEINGQWGMVQVPGTVDSTGNINNTVPISDAGSSGGCVLMAASKHIQDSWTFMKWWTEADTQYKFGKELESVMGVGARYNTANLEVIKKLPWQVQDKKVLLSQISKLKGIPQVPGGYLTSRNCNFAIYNVYNHKTDARDTLSDYIDQINNEITLKRKEFGLS